MLLVVVALNANSEQQWQMLITYKLGYHWSGLMNGSYRLYIESYVIGHVYTQVVLYVTTYVIDIFE